MCGRFTRSKDYYSQHANQREFLDQLGLDFSAPIAPSYNVAPTQQIVAVRASEDNVTHTTFIAWKYASATARSCTAAAIDLTRSASLTRCDSTMVSRSLIAD